MSDKDKKINTENNDSKNNEENSPEKSLFSTMMKGTPNLLDLIDPVKMSDSAFSNHKQKKQDNNSDEVQLNERPSDIIQEEQTNRIIEEEIESVPEDLKIIEEGKEESIPLPPMPLDLPLPQIEEENQDIIKIPIIPKFCLLYTSPSPRDS